MLCVSVCKYDYLCVCMRACANETVGLCVCACICEAEAKSMCVRVTDKWEDFYLFIFFESNNVYGNNSSAPS